MSNENEFVNPVDAAGELPEDEAFHQLVQRRRRSGRVWLTLFQASLVISMIALLALLYNILNQSVGLVAVRNSVEPTTLVRNAEERNMLALAASNPARTTPRWPRRLPTTPTPLAFLAMPSIGSAPMICAPSRLMALRPRLNRWKPKQRANAIRWRARSSSTPRPELSSASRR